MLPSLPIEPEPRVIPAAPPQSAPLNDLGTVLSPSQVRTFRDCGAKWYYKYALGLPDPPNGSLVRGRVVHQMAEAYFRAKLDGGSPDPDDLQASFEEACGTPRVRRPRSGPMKMSTCLSARPPCLRASTSTRWRRRSSRPRSNSRCKASSAACPFAASWTS